MRFEPGQTVLRRYWRGERISFLQAVRVVADDEQGLLLWLQSGSSVLIWMPAGEPYSVWWFFSPEGDFQSWYGNLEQPFARWRLAGAESHRRLGPPPRGVSAAVWQNGPRLSLRAWLPSNFRVGSMSRVTASGNPTPDGRTHTISTGVS